MDRTVLSRVADSADLGLLANSSLTAITPHQLDIETLT